MLKIGFDAKRAFLNSSGLGNYSRDIIRNLHMLFPENNYTLFTPKTNTHFLEKEFQSHVSVPQGAAKLFKSYWRSYIIPSLINKLDLDIYHGLSNELPFNIDKVKAKKIVTIHDLIFLTHPHLYKPLDRLFYEKKTKAACKKADAIIAISTQTKNDLIEYYNVKSERISVIYQCCNEQFYISKSPSQKEFIRKKYNLPEKYILNVGTVEPRKNALAILKALNACNTKLPLVIVGRHTTYLKVLIEYALKNNLSKQLIILDNVTNEDLPGIYQMCAMFIYPSLYEGFGIPILEAFNSKVPVITSNIGSMAEVAGNAAILTDPLDFTAVKNAIETLSENSDLANTYVEKGTKRAEIFKKEIVTKNLMDLYTSIL